MNKTSSHFSRLLVPPLPLGIPPPQLLSKMKLLARPSSREITRSREIANTDRCTFYYLKKSSIAFHANLHTSTKIRLFGLLFLPFLFDAIYIILKKSFNFRSQKFFKEGVVKIDGRKSNRTLEKSCLEM